MLVLSRKQAQEVVIGGRGRTVIDGPVIVSVIQIRGDKVRLGIEAPKDVPVHRREVYDAIQRENEAASVA